MGGGGDKSQHMVHLLDAHSLGPPQHLLKDKGEDASNLLHMISHAILSLICCGVIFATLFRECKSPFISVEDAQIENITKKQVTSNWCC